MKAYNGKAWTLINADCVAALKVFKDNRFDSLVTDPPAGIGFMGKDWDGDKGGRDQWVAWLAGVMREALRVLKPGAHALVWALPRTSHWTATACEDAGFEVRDVVMHLFGTGFPKSLNVGEGRGTALKPAAEHWILCRKPLTGTVVKNVAAYGTGALNIDGCRIDGVPRTTHAAGNIRGTAPFESTAPTGVLTAGTDAGRWPAHLTLDEEAAALLDAQSGTLKARGNKGPSVSTGVATIAMGKNTVHSSGTEFNHGGDGGASRFFYVAKPSTSERDAGCESLPQRSGGEATGREDGSAGVENPRAGAGRGGGRRNFHPTVKPVALMRWLCRLITPPGGTVLDPFAGSGTTGVAALAEGFQFVGMEQSADYAPIATARLSACQIADSKSEGIP